MAVNQEFDFEKDGFIVLRGVFSEQVLAPMRVLLADLIAYADHNYDDPFDRYYLRHRADQGVLYDLYQRHPEFTEMAKNPLILDALEVVLGRDILLYENSLVYKPKGKKNGVPFHQDFISRSDEPLKFIAWMAIDRVTKTGGALKVIPGSHRNGFLPWFRVKGETHHDRVDASGLDLSKVHHVELEPGDVLIFNQLVVHGSDEAHTESMRLVYRVSYQSFDEIFVPRGAPIVVRGGGADSLSRRFNKPFVPQRKSLLRRALNRLGRSLASV
ncbi:MAG TPA: phytanoyl-CoA dioxygenase family protein [Nevskia sp.]|nr:phytanoyl-CoA dioxygenase family protein [Nevskia sp.]